MKRWRRGALRTAFRTCAVLTGLLVAVFPISLFCTIRLWGRSHNVAVSDGGVLFFYGIDSIWAELRWVPRIRCESHVPRMSELVLAPSADFVFDAPAFRVVAIPLWMPAVLFALLSALAWRLGRRRVAQGHCANCGYNLTGNVSGRCPECGIAAVGEASTDGPDGTEA
jgi:hypothetical protein